MSRRRVASLATLPLSLAALAGACGGAPAAPPVTSDSPALASSSPPPAASSAPEATPASPPAACGVGEVRDPHGNCVASVCPAGQALGSDGTCKAPAPCIDGQEIMGACLCPRGKSADDTGHCVFAKCPEGSTGGTVFRNEATGECMECRPGTSPCGDHCCPGAGRRGR